MPRVKDSRTATVVESLTSILQIPLLRFRHARMAREREETAKLQPISDRRYFELAIPDCGASGAQP